MIHQTAIVHKDANLADDVEVGPYTIIGARVEIAEGCWIGPHVVINGPTKIGKNSKVYQFSSVGDAPQHSGHQGEDTRLEIGERNIIREYCTLNRGSSVGDGVTRIGNDNFLMAYVHVAHDCTIGNNTIFANCASLAGHVEVGDYAILGGFTVAHQFCRIGAHGITALGTFCFKDLPTYFLASGNPAVPHGINAKGLKRRDFSRESIEAIKGAYKVLYRSRKSYKDALVTLEELSKSSAEVAELLAFLKGTERGIIR